MVDPKLDGEDTILVLAEFCMWQVVLVVVVVVVVEGIAVGLVNANDKELLFSSSNPIHTIDIHPLVPHIQGDIVDILLDGLPLLSYLLI